MANRKNDIERYLRGELTPAEMHALEREAMRDPFLAEALEGIDQAGKESFLYDLNEIHKKVNKRTRKKRGKIISFSRWSYGIAASILFIVASSAIVVKLIKEQHEKQSLTMNKNQTKEIQVEKDSVATTPAKEDPGPLTLNEKSKSKPQSKRRLKQQSSSVANDAQTEDIHEATKPDAIATEQLAEVIETEESVIGKNNDVSDANVAKQGVSKQADVFLPSEPNSASKETYASTDSKTVSGRVISAIDGAPLPGVNVMVKGTTIGTVTDVNGQYQISGVSPNQTLVFNFIGLQSQEVYAGNKNNISVEMDSDVTQLSEVVVTGMGVSRFKKQKVVEKLATPQGGRDAFEDYLKKNVVYPDEAKAKKTEGRVTVRFSVEPNGELTEFEIIRGIGNGCDEELIRLIKSGPSWTPTTKNGVAVKDKVKVRFKFELSE